MIEFGNTLRQAREAKGLSLEQLSETTHIVRSQLDALEHEQFEIFAAPVYVRGYIKIICGEFGIDPKPLIEEYMEILNGNREPAIKERPLANATGSQPNVPPPMEPPSIEPQPVGPQPVEPQPEMPIISETDAISENPTVESVNESNADVATISMGSLFDDEQTQVPEKPMKAPTFSSGFDEEPPEMQKPAESAQLSRYAAPIREYSGNAPSVGGRYLRLGILLAVVIVGIYLIFLGIRALYRATTPEDAEKNKSDEVQKIEEVMHPEQKQAEKTAAAKPKANKPAAAKPAAAKPAVKRTPQKIPSLYID